MITAIAIVASIALIVSLIYNANLSRWLNESRRLHSVRTTELFTAQGELRNERARFLEYRANIERAEAVKNSNRYNKRDSKGKFLAKRELVRDSEA